MTGIGQRPTPREPARAAVPIPDDVVAAVRESEIRSFLLGLGAQGRLDAVRAGIDTNDVETPKAVVGAPKVLSLVPDAIREAAEEALLRGITPEKLQRSRDLKLAAAYLREAVSLAKSAILRASGTEPTLAERIRPVVGRRSKRHSDSSVVRTSLLDGRPHGFTARRRVGWRGGSQTALLSCKESPTQPRAK